VIKFNNKQTFNHSKKFDSMLFFMSNKLKFESTISINCNIKKILFFINYAIELENMTVLSEKKGHGLKKREIIRTYCDNSIDFFE